MLSKNEVKYIQSLCHKKLRDEDHVFVAEGVKLVDELLKSDFEIVTVYAVERWGKNSGLKVRVIEVSDDELVRISSLQTPNQVLAIARQKKRNDEPVLNNTISLVLDGIQDPGNMGTILRIADWFGISQVIASYDTVDVYNNKVVQATMGSIFRVNFWYKPLIEWLAYAQIPVYGAVLNGQTVYETGRVNEGLLLVGNEGNGIKKEIAPFITHPVTIPKIGEAESLNAAVATGIILSHMVERAG